MSVWESEEMRRRDRAGKNKKHIGVDIGAGKPVFFFRADCV